MAYLKGELQRVAVKGQQIYASRYATIRELRDFGPPVALLAINPSECHTTPSLGAPPLLNQEGSSGRLPSSDEEGWRAERRGGLTRGMLAAAL